MESKAGSKFLFYRASYRKTASHFSGSTLTIREKALGPNHPDVAQSLNSLALLAVA